MKYGLQMDVPLGTRLTGAEGRALRTAAVKESLHLRFDHLRSSLTLSDAARPATVRPGYKGPAEGWPNLDNDPVFNRVPYTFTDHPILQQNLDAEGRVLWQGKPADGMFLYSIGPDGGVRLEDALLPDRSAERPNVNHAELLHGHNSYGAGMAFFEQGRVNAANDNSGHYRALGNAYLPYLQHLLVSAKVAGADRMELRQYREEAGPLKNAKHALADLVFRAARSLLPTA